MSFWWYLLLFLGSLLFTGVFRWYAVKISLLDIPNSRSSHGSPTPRGGGLAVIVFFITGGWLLTRFAVLPGEVYYGSSVCLLAVAAVGLVDDIRSVPALIRLPLHLLASSLAVFLLVPVYSGMFFPWEWGNSLLLVIGLSWGLNLFNFMDGIDGIAAVETLCVAGGALLLLTVTDSCGMYCSWLGVLVAATAGFLAWNWPPAKIFMGDACSGFLGFCLGLFAVTTSGVTRMTLWSWLILSGVFIVDATVTLLRRIWRKERFCQAHRSHAYQILARRLQSHKRVTLGVLAVNVFWLLPLAFFSILWPFQGHVFTFVAYAPLVLLGVMVGAGVVNE